mgnify:CR=1 FL=1
MELRQLRYFVHILDLGSFTAASDLLNIAQPALSRQIKALEEELNTPLLLRHGRGVTPTDEGRALAQKAKGILEDIRQLKEEFKDRDAPLHGSIKLGLPPTVSNILATHLIERTMQGHPGINLQISSGFSGHVQDWLSRGKIDLGIAYGEQKPLSVDSRPILKEKLYLIQSTGDHHCDADMPISLHHALSKPLILPNTEHGLRKRVDAIAHAFGVELNVVLEIDVLESMLGFVERGLGCTILPKVSVANHVRAARFATRPIVQPNFERTLILMTSGVLPASKLLARFSDFLISEVHSMVDAGDWPGTSL